MSLHPSPQLATLATCHAHSSLPRVPARPPESRIPRTRQIFGSDARAQARPGRWRRHRGFERHRRRDLLCARLGGSGGTEPVGHAGCLAGRRAAGVCWRDGVCRACSVTPLRRRRVRVSARRVRPPGGVSHGVDLVRCRFLRCHRRQCGRPWPAFWVGSSPLAADTTPALFHSLGVRLPDGVAASRRGAYGDRGAVGHSHRGPRAWAHRSKPAGRIQGRRLDGGGGIRVFDRARNHGELLGG